MRARVYMFFSVCSSRRREALVTSCHRIQPGLGPQKPHFKVTNDISNLLFASLVFSLRFLLAGSNETKQQ